MKGRALKHVDPARSIDPEHWLVWMTLVCELCTAGRIDKAIPLVRREVQREPLNLVRPGPGHPREFSDRIALLIALDGTPWGAFHAAGVQACRGEGASSMDRLKRIDSGALQVMLRCGYGLGIDEDHARVGG